ncbi:zinc finger protein 521-like [Saccostrea echinata]|uniref:zinc finger protein 521-like n=1 Tax=Saccostrea echinata TaxID=191078 RepID=UPI002A82AF8A|nr:zinc finger protein 521-like [Saccostrea echinata]
MSVGRDTCLHCGTLIPDNQSPSPPLIDSTDTEWTDILLSVFSKEKVYHNAGKESFCDRCKSSILQVHKIQEESVDAINNLAALARTQDVSSNLLSQNVVSSAARDAGHDWFFVSYNSKEGSLLWKGSKKGWSFINSNKSISHSFFQYCTDKDENQIQEDDDQNDREEEGRLTTSVANFLDESDENSGGSQDLLWNCCVCNLNYRTKKLLLDHIQKTHSLKGEDARIVAKRKFNPDSTEVSRSKVVRMEDRGDKERSEKDDQKHWKCLECGKIYMYKSNVKCHLKKEHNISLTESSEYISEATFEEVSKALEKEKERCLYKCKRCERVYSLKSSLVRHLKTYHHIGMKNASKFIAINNIVPQDDTVSHEAPSLDQTPIITDIRNYPTEGAEKVKVWICKICQVSFQDQKLIEEHMSQVHEMRVSKSRAYMEIPKSEDDEGDENDDESDELGPPNIFQSTKTDEDNPWYGDSSSLKIRVKQWGCQKCGGEFCHKKDALRHLRIRHYLSEEKRYTYLKKLDTIDSMPELEKETSTPPKNVKNWQCTKCSNKYVYKRDACRHILLHHGIEHNRDNFIIYSGSQEKRDTGMDKNDVIIIESNDEEQLSETEDIVTAANGEKFKWGCQKCKKIFLKKTKVGDHMRTYHNLSLAESGEKGKNILVQSPLGKGIQWKKDVGEEDEVHVDVESTEGKPQKEWFCKLCHKSYFRHSDGARHCRNTHKVTYEEGKLMVMHISEMSGDEMSKSEEKINRMEEEKEETKKEQPWKCIKCNKQFQCKTDVERHLTDDHFITDQDHEFFIERNKNYARKWKCCKCGQRFFHRFDTSRHVNLTHDIVWEKTKDFVQFLDEVDLSFEEAQNKDDSKPYVCLICQKLFCAKKPLMSHLQKFHKAKINADNFGEHVLSFHKIHARNWDCLSSEDGESRKNTVPLSLLSSYMMDENQARVDESLNVNDVVVKTLSLEGPYSEENWAKIIGTSYESTCNKSTSYRPKNDMENKQFSCMLCNLRYYKMKEAQRHMFLKHKISYIEAVNYITENKDVVFNQDAEGLGERTPKRRKIGEGNSHVFFCTQCMKSAIHFQSSQLHIVKYHKEKKENIHKKICRSQNVEVLKLGNEDKMNFVCVICFVTFRSRIDGFKHIAKEHSMVPQDEISEFLFTKEDKMKTCIVKFEKLNGVIKIFSITTEDILNDVKFSEENSKEEGSDSEDDKKKSIKIEKDDGREIRMEYENVEDSLAILLMNMSNPESFQKFTYDEFYYIFSIPAKSHKNVTLSEVSHIPCPNCPREFVDQYALHKHLLSCCVPRQNAWECLNCRKSFKSVGVLVKHIQKMYGIQGTDVLNFMRSREILIAPENGVEISVDGRNDQDIHSLYQSKTSEENMVEEDETADEFELSLDEGDSRKLCFVCGHQCTDRKNLFKHCEEVHFITGHNNRFTECMQCVSYFKSRKDIMDHLQKVHGVKCPRLHEKNHICVICEEKFSDNVQLAKHVKTHGIQFACKHCSKKFGSYSKMATHLKIHTEKFTKKPLNCTICNLSVPGESYLGHLIVHYDRKYGPWKCLVCEKDFHLRRNLKEHLKGEHKTFICEKCGRTFNCMYTFKRHESVHKSQIKCTLCSKQFDTKIELAIHRRVHIKYWICHFCGRNLSNQTSLNSHLKAHREKRIVTSAQKSEKFCQICNRSFSNHELYQKHKAIHKGDRLHSCQYCGKKYSYIGSLKLHYRTYHPEHKPYRCVVCGKTFSTFHQRFLHMREHKDYKDPIRPFKCSFCSGRFKHKMSLQRHERLKHFNESLTGFRCDKCDREFTNGQSLLRHAMFCEPAQHPQQPTGAGSSVIVENESGELEVVAEETITGASSVQYSVVEEPQSMQVHTINIGSEVLSVACSDQEELILEVPEGMLVETDSGYQIIVSEGN